MTGACETCGLPHREGQLFVITGVDPTGGLIMIDTCELEPAWRAAHSILQPEGSLGYHATNHVEDVLAHGLDPRKSAPPCRHVCLAETAESAAGMDVGAVVLEVDVSGLDLFFELGEARHHDCVIPRDRLRVLNPQPAPVRTGWSDPAWRRNHSDCLARRGYPLSRRLLNAAADEMRTRWPFDPPDDSRFRTLLDELAEHRE